MNRIYQGLFSGAQLIDTKGEAIADEKWDGESALWEHHALFQDAVKI